jgi:hypothetical protein
MATKKTPTAVQELRAWAEGNITDIDEDEVIELVAGACLELSAKVRYLEEKLLQIVVLNEKAVDEMANLCEMMGNLDKYWKSNG